jgi:site-specific DNA recombinase
VRAQPLRFSRRKPNRPGGSSKREPSLLSGLLRCGACGGAFSVIGRRIKKGVYYASLGCSANRNRGDAICANNRTVSERKVNQVVVEGLRKQLTTPKLLQDFVTAFKKRFSERHGAEAPELADLERELAATEGRIKNLTDALGKMGFSRAIAEALRVEEEKLEETKARLASARKRSRPNVVPHPKVVESYIANLLALLEADKTRARELLAKHMQPLVMTPVGRTYRVTGGFDLSLCIDESGHDARPAEQQVLGKVSRRDRD